MATTEASICNRALLRVGINKTIDALTDSTAEAQACNILYEQVRDELLQRVPWPFATQREELVVITDGERNGWDFAYALPSDCLQVRGIWSGARRPRVESRVRFATEYSASQRILLCDLEATASDPVELTYTVRVEDPTRFPPLFVSALAYALAAELAMALPVKEGTSQRMLAMLEVELSKATAAAFAEEQQDPEPDSAFVAARGTLSEDC